MLIKQGTRFKLKQDFKGLERGKVYEITAVSGGTVSFSKVFGDALITKPTMARATFDKLKKEEVRKTIL